MKGYRKWTKRAVSLGLAALLTLSAAGCSGGGDPDGGSSSGGGDEKLTISFGALDNLTEEQWGTEFHQFFMDKFNIEWDFNYIEWASWDEMMRVWINSGDLPDVSIWNYNYTDAENYSKQGLLYKFPDDWKERWPNAAMAYEASPLNTQLEEKFGGTYVMLRPTYVYHAQTDPIVNQIGVIGIRKDWAEAVGFEIKDAYTVDEILEFARLVKEQDPGNLGSSLIPICFDPANALTCFVSSNSRHSRIETAFYKDENGEYQWGPADESVLETLKIYQQAYREGLLDPEFYLLNDNDKDKFYINGTVAVYHMGGVAEFRQTVDTEMRNNLRLNSDDVVHEAILLGNDEKYHNIILGSNYWSSLIFSPDISEENFERIMDLIDWTCTEEGQTICNMGIEGVDWEYQDGEAVSILPEDTSLLDKYGPRVESVYILEDDFAVVNPSIKEEYRNRMNGLAQLKLDHGEGKYDEIDWDQEFHVSRAKDRVQFNYGEEYANLIVQEGDLETNWNSWVEDKMPLVQEYLDELNSTY